MQSLIQLSEQLGERLLQQGEVLATAESCTGGGVANMVTEVAGSSAWFDRAFVTYSNEAKQEMLGVAEKPWPILVRSRRRWLKKWYWGL